MSNSPQDCLEDTYLLRLATADVNTDESTSSTSYTDLATVGPSVTLITGTSVMIGISFEGYRASGTAQTQYVAPEVSGASTIAATEAFCTAASRGANVHNAVSTWYPFTGLTPGLNTFTLKYKVDGSTFNFKNRTLIVIPT